MSISRIETVTIYHSSLLNIRNERLESLLRVIELKTGESVIIFL
jgi:hypothetical protein